MREREVASGLRVARLPGRRGTNRRRPVRISQGPRRS